MKVCEWKFSFSFAYIREKFFFEFSSFYPRYMYYRFPRTRTAGRSVFSKTPIEPNMKKIRESCQTGLAKTWLCSSLRDKILPVNRNDNPRNQSISANRFQPRFRAIDYIDHFKLKRVYGDRYSQRHLHWRNFSKFLLFLKKNWKELDYKGILFYAYNIIWLF